MLKPRSAKKEEFSKVINLINLVFRTSRGEKPTMASEFPLLLTEKNINNMIVLEKDSEILADINFKTQDTYIQNSKLNVAFIGAVCTHPNHCGHGYASTILDYVENKMYNDGVDLVSISGTRSLYARRMCTQVKNFFKYTILPKNNSLDFSIVEYNDTYLDSMLNLYNQNSTRFYRSKEDFKLLLNAATMPWGKFDYKKYILLNNNNIVIGYIILKIINDEENSVGKVSEAFVNPTILYNALGNLCIDLNLKEISHFVHVKDFSNHLPYFDTIEEDYMGGTIKIINAEGLFTKLKPYFYQYVNKDLVDNLTLKSMNNIYEITYKDEILILETIEEVNKLVFEGSKYISKDFCNCKNIKLFIDSVFPLNFPWTENLNYQ